jgi:hypothetical protein
MFKTFNWSYINFRIHPWTRQATKLKIHLLCMYTGYTTCSEHDTTAPPWSFMQIKLKNQISWSSGPVGAANIELMRRWNISHTCFHCMFYRGLSVLKTSELQRRGCMAVSMIFEIIWNTKMWTIPPFSYNFVYLVLVSLTILRKVNWRCLCSTKQNIISLSTPDLGSLVWHGESLALTKY